MNFLLTRYIYPIESKNLLSERLNIFLDNPRTDKEIEAIAEYLRYSEGIAHVGYDHNWRLPREEEVDVDHEIVTLDGIVNGFLERYVLVDTFVQKFKNENENTEFFTKLAKMWIVARYDDEGQIQVLREESIKLSEEGGHVFLLDEDNPIVRNSKNLVNYSYLLSLLIHTEGEEYYGKTFLLHHSEYEIERPKVDKFLNQNLVYFGIFSCSEKICKDPLAWLFYPPVKSELYKVAETIDSVLDDTSVEKILYVANLLAVAGNEVNDEKVMLMVLVGIMELMLTHSPDFNRFNVEDSISKQFKLKASLLIYLNDKSTDLGHIKKRLGVIYAQRSNIAHGNFKKLDKYMKGLSKKEGEEEYFEDLVHELYEYLRAILYEYIRDREFVEFLKDN